MPKKQPKNVGINPIGHKYKAAEREAALQALEIAKKQNRPVKFLKKTI